MERPSHKKRNWTCLLSQTPPQINYTRTCGRRSWGRLVLLEPIVDQYIGKRHDSSWHSIIIHFCSEDCLPYQFCQTTFSYHQTSLIKVRLQPVDSLTEHLSPSLIYTPRPSACNQISLDASLWSCKHNPNQQGSIQEAGSRGSDSSLHPYKTYRQSDRIMIQVFLKQNPSQQKCCYTNKKGTFWQLQAPG